MVASNEPIHEPSNGAAEEAPAKTPPRTPTFLEPVAAAKDEAVAIDGMRRPQTVQARGVCYDVQVPSQDGDATTTRRLLDEINVTVKPSSLTAIMGASGAGKTTLLNMLAGRIQPTSGSLTVNGNAYTNTSMQRKMGYVMQDDKLMPTQTVRETLMFAAKLMLPESTTDEECEARVQAIIDELGLVKVADSLVGAEGIGQRGISGGERKRVSIGLVLIPDPDILLLDEPTTGLDSFTAESVVGTLRDLAAAGRTVICTIHQPSTQVFEQFTNLVMLSEGRLVYNGKALDSMAYFNEIGYTVPQYANPPDFYMKLMRTGDADQTTRGSLRALKDGEAERVTTKLAQLWAERGMDTSLPPVEKEDLTSEPYEQYAVGFFRQFLQLLMRSFRNHFRHAVLFRARLVSSAVLGLIVGLVFFDSNDEPAGVRAKQGALFFVLINQAMLSLNNVLHTFPAEMGLVMREHQSNFYSISAYFWSKTSVELPFMTLFPTVYITVLYYMVGFREDPEYYFQLVVLVVLMSWCAQSAGMLISAAASSFEMAMVMGPLVFLPMALMAGFLTQDLPSWLVWFENVSFMKWAFDGAVVNEFRGRALVCPPDTDAFASQCRPTGDVVLAELGATEAEVWSSVVVLLLYFGCLRLLTWLTLLIKSRMYGGIQQ